MFGLVRLAGRMIEGGVDFAWNVMMGVLWTIGWVPYMLLCTMAYSLGNLVALPTSCRISLDDKNFTKRSSAAKVATVLSTIGMALSMLYALTVTGVYLLAPDSMANAKRNIVEDYDQVSAYVPYLGWILLGLLGTNVVSLFYEIGHWIEKGARANAEENTEEEAHDPIIYLDAMDKLECIQQMTKELAEEWYRKIGKMLERGEIDPGESKSLMENVEKKLPATEKVSY